MADEAAAAAAVQDAGNGEAKVSKNALKKQVMRLPLGRLQPFLFPSRNFFPTKYVRKCKHRFSIHVNTETVLTLSVIVVPGRQQFAALSRGLSVSISVPKSLFPGAANPGSCLQSARCCRLQALVRNAGKKWLPRDDRQTSSIQSRRAYCCYVP